jgi:hypothetical protein
VPSGSCTEMVLFGVEDVVGVVVVRKWFEHPLSKMADSAMGGEMRWHVGGELEEIG